MREKATTIWIKPRTKRMLDKVGNKGETYDDIINRIIAEKGDVIPFDSSVRYYRQGIDAVPFFISIPYSTMFNIVRNDVSFTFNFGRKNYGYWEYDVTKERAMEHIKKQLKDGNFISERRKRWLSFVEKQKKIESLIKELDSKTDKEIFFLLRKLTDIILETWKLSIIIELYDPNSEEIILEMLSRYDKSHMTLVEFKRLCMPDMLTQMQKEHIEILEIADSGEFDRLGEHVKKYFWIKNSWSATRYLDENFFREKIQRLKEEGINFRAEEDKIRKNREDLKKEKAKIRKKRKISAEIEKVIRFFEILTIWREERKKCSLVTNHYMDLILEEISKRTGVRRDILTFATCYELLENINSDFVEKLKKRMKACIFYLDNGKERFICGDSVGQFYDDLVRSKKETTERLYGNMANPGKVEGKAKIIFTEADIAKMEKGDVLVAPCTRPEYLPAMKIASAIITDEGGITSHAAIVSRELGLPCVVGLQHATDVIKDGDRIYVNANHGVVERLE